MWKKDEEQAGTRAAGTVTSSEPRRPAASSASGRAIIGPSISIKGDVTGSEDLLIQGQVDGSVTLEDHAVGVGPEGRVNADIVGRVITIEGRVEGDLKAQEQIVLRGTAHVKGDIKAPRVVLEDGATFRGLVDMGTASKAAANERAVKEEAGATSSAAGSNGETRAASGETSAPKSDVSVSDKAASPSDEKSAKSRAASGGRASASA